MCIVLKPRVTQGNEDTMDLAWFELKKNASKLASIKHVKYDG